MKGVKKKTDAKLVSKAIKGDKTSLNILCEQKAHSILYVCKNLTGNIQDAEDLSQNVILRMCTSLNKLKKSASFDAWLYRVIRNELLTQLKNKSPNEEYGIEHMGNEVEAQRASLPEMYLEDIEKRKTLQELLNELPLLNRYCIIMFYFEDMSYKEIAEVMEISENEVGIILYRSKNRMRKILEKKTDAQDNLSNFALIASPAILGTYMKQEAAALSVEALMPSLTSALGQLPASAGTMTLISSKVTAAIGIATAATLAVSVGVSINNEIPSEQAVISTSQTEQIDIVEENIILDTQEIPIHSLEDMIGAENANLLYQYSVSPPSQDEWQLFLRKLGMTSLRKSNEEGTFYLLYALEKQDKRLMVIVKQTGQEEIQGLVYNFDTIEKLIPTYYEVIQSYETW